MEPWFELAQLSALTVPWFDRCRKLIQGTLQPEIRKAIYTTYAIESVNRSLRKISKNRGVFPHEESLLKLYFIGLERIAQKWTMPIQNWSEALNRFAIEFGDRMPQLN